MLVSSCEAGIDNAIRASSPFPFEIGSVLFLALSSKHCREQWRFKLDTINDFGTSKMRVSALWYALRLCRSSDR